VAVKVSPAALRLLESPSTVRAGISVPPSIVTWRGGGGGGGAWTSGWVLTGGAGATGCTGVGAGFDGAGLAGACVTAAGWFWAIIRGGS